MSWHKVQVLLQQWLLCLIVPWLLQTLRLSSISLVFWKEGCYTALAVVTGGIGSVVVCMIRKWRAKRRHERVPKTTRACRKDDARETGLKDQVTLTEDISEKTPPNGVADAATNRS